MQNCTRPSLTIHFQILLSFHFLISHTCLIIQISLSPWCHIEFKNSIYFRLKYERKFKQRNQNLEQTRIGEFNSEEIQNIP